MHDLGELVREALECRRMSRHRCIVSNQAADDLSHYGIDALEAIETGVLSLVAPACGSGRAPAECGFAGTVHVMVKYFRLLYKHEMIARGRDFLAKLPPLVLVDGLHGLFIVEGNCAASKYQLTEPLQTFIEEIAFDSTADQRLRDLICRNCRLRTC